MSLKGKVALVTGGAQGIGKAIAVRLAKDGADVVIADINIDLAQSALAEMKSWGVSVVALKADVSDSQEVEDLIKKVHERFPTLDILVNNAGISKDGLLIRVSE
ncbi:MAG: SDR family NAD(P)-dependent oxidoreductase, partial [candidate division Zixibacteria bacterium]|nr:SDR family NAD(P)-dependent oxidoreductase [candidate division Zixibacteria bacterium]